MKHTLDLPERTDKPREYGITVVSDQGLGLRAVEDLIELAGDHIDYVKLSIGTAYVTTSLKEKIKLYRSSDIEVFFGGTLFEVYAVQNQIDNYKRIMNKNDIHFVEISNGLSLISEADRLHYIDIFKPDFEVITEVGCKDEDKITPPYKWVEMIEQSLEAGVLYVTAEGRESGDAGLYRRSREIRMGLIDEIVHQISYKKIIFEAPLANQQIYLINTVGANVNLGNIMARDIILLEAQRIGLKYETYVDNIVTVHG